MERSELNKELVRAINENYYSFPKDTANACERICLQKQIELLYSFDLGNGFVTGKEIAEKTLKLQQQLNQLKQ